jgi:hypothetical protein
MCKQTEKQRKYHNTVYALLLLVCFSSLHGCNSKAEVEESPTVPSNPVSKSNQQPVQPPSVQPPSAEALAGAQAMREREKQVLGRSSNER